MTIKKTYIISISIVFFFITPHILYTQTLQFSKITSVNEEVRKSAKVEILSSESKEQDGISKEILSALQQNTTFSKPIWRDMVEILGKLKRTEAIPYLVEHITFSTSTLKFSYGPIREAKH